MLGFLDWFYKTLMFSIFGLLITFILLLNFFCGFIFSPSIEHFYHEMMLNFVICFFCIFWEKLMSFIFHSINVVYHRDLHMLKHLCSLAAGLSLTNVRDYSCLRSRKCQKTGQPQAGTLVTLLNEMLPQATSYSRHWSPCGFHPYLPHRHDRFAFIFPISIERPIYRHIERYKFKNI